MSDALQEHIDRYYWEHGRCCAGCDWWRALNSSVGTCGKSAPVTAAERAGPLRIDATSLNVGAGKVFTKRDYECGDFRDTFDWRSLPIPYLARIGFHLPREAE